MMTQSAPRRFDSLCQTTSHGAPTTSLMAWIASWSQLDPGRTTTANFMRASSSGSAVGGSIEREGSFGVHHDDPSRLLMIREREGVDPVNGSCLDPARARQKASSGGAAPIGEDYQVAAARARGHHRASRGGQPD